MFMMTVSVYHPHNPTQIFTLEKGNFHPTTGIPNSSSYCCCPPDDHESDASPKIVMTAGAPR